MFDACGCYDSDMSVPVRATNNPALALSSPCGAQLRSSPVPPPFLVRRVAVLCPQLVGRSASEPNCGGGPVATPRHCCSTPDVAPAAPARSRISDEPVVCIDRCTAAKRSQMTCLVITREPVSASSQIRFLGNEFVLGHIPAKSCHKVFIPRET